MAVNWYFCTSFKTVMDVLTSQRADRDSSFSKRVILGYLDTKHKKGLNNTQIAVKLGLVEQAMFERQLPDRTKQIIEIRAQLLLPPSELFLACNIPYQPREAIDSRLYLPCVFFEDDSTDDLPAYSPFEY
ncbi:hypothetical protein BDY24DRAFT_402166 [Mrakia frigida]|uniref:uncharacterized protein n=1 Tax=Mrakia frigida TaxID=29902 RepID=UPI003FCC21A0